MMTDIRAHVTVPEEVRDLFSWLVKYDARFEGSPAAVAAHLLKLGARQLYAEGLAQATPLPDELAADLASRSRKALKESLEPAPKKLRKAG